MTGRIFKAIAICAVLLVCSPVAGTSETGGDGSEITAYYFYTTFRCASCLTIEKWTQEAISQEFEETLSSGRLQFSLVNIQKPENARFIEEFQLYTKSVVLVETEGDATVRWKNLDRVWRLLGDEKAFKQYVAGELTAFLAEK